MSHYDPHFPSSNIEILFADTRVQLTGLRTAISGLTIRHPGSRVPPDTLEAARPVLAAVSRILAREENWRSRLQLGDVVSWATLAIKLQIATQGMRRFYAIHLAPIPDEFDDDEREDSEEGGTMLRSAPLPLEG